MSLAVHRNIMSISVVLCVVGVILVLGALLTESYTTTEPFRVDRSRVQIENSFTLWPNTNRTFERDSIATNSSIFQLTINNTNAVVIKIAEYNQKVVFERELDGSGGLELHYFWTPPVPSLWLFIFDNPYTTPTNVSVKVTEYYLKRTEYQEVTHQRPLLDPNYGYAGVAFIVVATVLNLAPLVHESWREHQRHAESRIGIGDFGKKQKGRQFTAISVILCVLGVVLVLESIVMMPYATLEPFRVDKSEILLNDSFTLHANTNKTYLFDSLVKNTSILEIYWQVSDAIGFKIIDQGNGRLEFSGRGQWRQLTIGQWEGEAFWTPPINSEWLFVHYNPFSTPRNVTVKVTEYYLKVVEYRNVTRYQPLLDPNYGYAGVAFIVVATVLNLAPLVHESWREHQRHAESRAIKRHQQRF